MTVTGWRLRKFLRLLRQGHVTAVKTGHPRYANQHSDAPFVAEIKIAPVKVHE